MNTLWLTLQRASYDLIMFFIGFLCIVCGFGFCGNLLFGHLLRDFHTLASSISALTRFMLGDFNYKELSTARPLLASTFFWMYNGVVYLVIMNMFIAIVTSYFEEVHQHAKVADRWKAGMPDLRYDLVKYLRFAGRRYVKNKWPGCYRFCCCRWLRSRPRKLVFMSCFLIEWCLNTEHNRTSQ